MLNSVTDTYSYDSANKLTGITGSVTKSYSYDTNGSCTAVTVGTGGGMQYKLPMPIQELIDRG